MRRDLILLFLCVATAVASSVHAAPAPDFNRDIRPILSDKCFRCHGPDEQERKGGEHGLRLDLAKGALEDLGGGAFAIVPGKPEKSELIARITSSDEEEIMPPRKTGKSLTKTEIELLRTWIASGGSYAPHWSYEPPRQAPLPVVRNKSWPRTPIDRFVLARLEQEALRPQPEADRATLARRLALDLTGLPPAMDEVEAFLKDRSANAYERYVDAQLAKTAYGEHWARSWLDLARYADSKGYADDQPRSIWKYRDYVIDALNQNLPFDQFTIEQLAGDLLPNPTPAQVFATGFHRNTMNNTEGGTDDEEFRSAAIIDRVNTTMAVWMGTTMACAQCHTHKYDPLTQEEYFRLYAILNNTQDADRGDEFPTLAVLTEDQKAQKQQWEAEASEIEKLLTTPTPELLAKQAEWEQAFPRDLAWATPKPATATSQAGAAAAVGEDGIVVVPAGQDADTYTVELPLGLNQVSAVR